MAARVTQATLRTLTQGTPSARVSQVTVRVLSETIRSVRASQVKIRVLSDNAPDDDVSPGAGGVGLPPVVIFF